MRRRHAGSVDLELDVAAVADQRHAADGEDLHRALEPEDLPVGGTLSLTVPQPRPSRSKERPTRYVVALAIIMLMLAVVLLLPSSRTPPARPVSQPPPAERRVQGETSCRSPGQVSYYHYEQILPGMRMSEVNRLIGTRGMVERSRSGSIGSYSWVNDDGSNILITVEELHAEEGKVISKAQFGLTPGLIMTCREFHRLYPGMQMGDVIERFRSHGQPSVRELSPGEALFIWENRDGSSLKVRFVEHKVVEIRQVGLR